MNIKTLMETPVNVYLKRHNNTGKLYFGKTIKLDVEAYKGSGKRWLNHINKHGKNGISNVFVETFEYKEDLAEFCEFFSMFYDITNSDKFMNLIPETGFDGGDSKFANYINVSGEIKKLLKTDDSSILGDGWVLRQSNEGRRRSGNTSTHKNKNTISVLNKITLETARINKEDFNEAIHVTACSKEFYVLSKRQIPERIGYAVVVNDLGQKFTVTKEEFARRDDVYSVVSTKGKAILGVTTNGNRKGMMNCVDINGKLCSVTSASYWEQESKFGVNRSNWPLVHHSHPEGKRRKIQESKL